MRVGGIDITDPRVGSTAISEVRYGSVLIWERAPPSGDVEIFSTGSVGNSDNPQTINFTAPTVNAGGTVVLMSSANGFSNAITGVTGGGTWSFVVVNENATPFRRAEIWYCTDMPAGVTTLTITRSSNSGAGSTVTELSPGADIVGSAAENNPTNRTSGHNHADVGEMPAVSAGGVMLGVLRFNSNAGTPSPASIAGATATTLQSGTLNLHEIHELGSDVPAGERMGSFTTTARQSAGAMVGLTIGGV